MIGWGALIWLTACGWGVLVFLALVANTIERSEQLMRLVEQRERKAQSRGAEGMVLTACTGNEGD